MDKLTLRSDSRKENFIIIRVSTEEKEMLKGLAKANNLNLTDLLKFCVNKQIDTFKKV